MYDFAKVEIKGIPINTIISNPNLEFTTSLNTLTGNIKNEKVGSFNGIKFTITNDTHIDVSGSFHKYFNNGLHNYNDFSTSQFVEVLKDLSEKFGINPFSSYLHHLEFGINIILPFCPKVFLNAIISYKGGECERKEYKHSGLLLRFSFQQYDLKIYDKGVQYESKTSLKNILRIEIKVKKMEYFNAKKIKICTLSDLLSSTEVIKLGDLLIKAYKNLLIYDKRIEIKNLKEREKEILLKGSSPKYWTELIKENPNNYQKKRQVFRMLVSKHSKTNLQKIVFDLIEKKISDVLLFDNETEKKIDAFFSSISNKTLPKITNKTLPKITDIGKSRFTENNPSYSMLKEVKCEGDLSQIVEVNKIVSLHSIPVVKKITKNWNNEIFELESFFKNAIIPDQPIKLNAHTTIVNIPLFVNSHFATIKANAGRNTFLPYLERLEKVKRLISITS